ncbi:Pyridoxal phosphate homeostasis protein [Nymphon striatum]|nr:Pyridoxal phosphate homeostasis protein [Nymphon striatum]
MTQISDNLQIIGAKLKNYSLQYNRSENAVKLLAVSKRHDSEKIREAYACGQRAFGENYVQELWDKYQQLSDLEIEWHYIGPLQSNKTRKEASKSGISENQITDLAKEIIKLPNLKLRGLMVIPAPEDNFEKQLEVFSKVSAIKDRLNLEQGIELDTLSMGMSNDIEAAIAGGSTLVRVGTAIFGKRED